MSTFSLKNSQLKRATGVANTLMVTRGKGGGRSEIRWLGLAYTNYFI